ncbi:MAG TPA: FlhC family transcriptional regulator [Steroidobacter sp.]|uniref:FlhC family transcriptional regulator n=1 Tax=Steroidobacter sp. TaxID=1978227 RepID=UPI002EDB3B63
MNHKNDSYRHERCRQDLALRMIRHEARTCTIRECTGLTDDRIRRLYRSYAHELSESPVRRRRGKSPRQTTFFIRNTRAQFESSLLASAFAAFGLLHAEQGAKKTPRAHVGAVEYGRLFCDAYETHQQLLDSPTLSFEHAWFLLQLLNRSGDLQAARCRHCDSYYLRNRFNVWRHTCPTCRLKRMRARCKKSRRLRLCSNSRAVSHD